MKRFILVSILGATIAGSVIVNSAEVEPAQVEVTFLRDTGGGFVSDTEFFRGDTIRLTNCVVYTGATTNTAVQDLTGITLSLIAGNTAYTNNTSTTGNILVATNGTFWADVVIPTNQPGINPYIQLTITDGDSDSFTFPWEQAKAKDKLE